MRKLVYILVLVLFASVSFGQQNLTVKGLKANFDFTVDVAKAGSPQSYVFGYFTNTISDSDSIWTKVIGIDNCIEAHKAEVLINVDRLTGTVVSNVFLQYKTFWNEAAWTNVDTVVVNSASDVKIKLQTPTAVSARFWRVYNAGSNGTYTWKPSIFEFKITE